MRLINDIKATDNYCLYIEFSTGEKKTFDMTPYLKLPAFSDLNKVSSFINVSNKQYFIEWEALEIDLSADTLWHEGK